MSYNIFIYLMDIFCKEFAIYYAYCMGMFCSVLTIILIDDLWKVADHQAIYI